MEDGKLFYFQMSTTHRKLSANEIPHHCMYECMFIVTHTQKQVELALFPGLHPGFYCLHLTKAWMEA